MRPLRRRKWRKKVPKGIVPRDLQQKLRKGKA